MVADGFLGEPKPLCHLGGRASVSEQLEHLLLPRRESRLRSRMGTDASSTVAKPTDVISVVRWTAES
jgi:hypothetical protein